MSGTLTAFVRLARPHQWVKNGFVLVGLVFGHAWSDPAAVVSVLWMFGAFCLASSAVYTFNDIFDRDADRQHPRKRERPLARGTITPGVATGFGLLLAAGAVAMAARVSSIGLLIIAAYVLLNVAYSMGLKHVAILDVFIIAAGFMLRILAGTLGVGIEPSRWLVLCGLMITVFLGFAKRRAELMALQSDDAAAHRPVLEEYDEPSLDNMIAISAAGVIVTYSLYTVDEKTVALHGTDQLVLTLPFVLYGMFRYIFLLHRRGGGGDPAAELLGDAHLIVAVLGWLALTLWLLV